MISLTRLNHQNLILNCDLIKTIEGAHDTVITLVSGEKLNVEESPSAIVGLVQAYRAQLAAAVAALPPIIPTETHPE